LKAAADNPDVWRKLSPRLGAAFQDTEAEVRLAALNLVTQYLDRSFLADTHALLSDANDTIRETAARSLKLIGDAQSAAALVQAAEEEEDEYIRVEIGETLLELADPRGIPILIDVMDHGEVPNVRKHAHEHLTAHIPVIFSFRTDLAAPDNDGEVEPFRRWWRENRDRLVWEERSRAFRIR
jgi:HEAT repeat protein